MKRFLLVLLCLATVLVSFASCAKEDSEDLGETGEGTTQTVSVSGNPFEDRSIGFTVVYPDKEEAYYAPLASELIAAVKAKTGVTLSVKSDFEKDASASVKNDAYEILIGATNRAESQNAECPEGKYLIKTDGNKLVLTGNDRFYITFAVKHVISELIGSSESGKLFNISADYNVATELKNAASTYVDMGDKISDELTWEKVAFFPFLEDGTLNVMQGGCTDGEYFYFLINDGDDKTANSKSRIIKVDPISFNVVKTGPTIYVRHANDMTYNSKTGQLVISWCSVDSKCYSVVDMKSLDVTSTGTVYNTNGFYAIDYCAEKDKYVAAETTNGDKEYRLQILSGKPGSIKYDSEPFDTLDTGYTKQGIHCDGKYIYLAQSPSSEHRDNNIIAVFDWEGKHVRTFTVDLPGESENVFWYNGNLYSAYNSNADGAEKLSLYKLTFNFAN